MAEPLYQSHCDVHCELGSVQDEQPGREEAMEGGEVAEGNTRETASQAAGTGAGPSILTSWSGPHVDRDLVDRELSELLGRHPVPNHWVEAHHQVVILRCLLMVVWFLW